MKKLKVKVTFTEEILGTASNDKEVHKEFIASKAPDAPSREEEVAAVGVEEVFGTQFDDLLVEPFHQVGIAFFERRIDRVKIAKRFDINHIIGRWKELIEHD